MWAWTRGSRKKIHPVGFWSRSPSPRANILQISNVWGGGKNRPYIPCFGGKIVIQTKVTPLIWSYCPHCYCTPSIQPSSSCRCSGASPWMASCKLSNTTQFETENLHKLSCSAVWQSPILELFCNCTFWVKLYITLENGGKSNASRWRLGAKSNASRWRLGAKSNASC